jgi:hypothetical protein
MGQTNHVSGIYRADHCNKPERSIADGKTFPPCPNCHSSITWTLVRRTDTNPGK